MDRVLQTLYGRLVEKWPIAVCVALCLSLLLIQAWWIRPSPDFEKALDAVVIVETPTGRGSGFFVTADGCAVTAAHVVREALAKKQRIVLRTRGVARRVPATVVAYNHFADIAVVCSPIEPPNWLRVIDTEGIQEGDPVFALGHPGERTWNVTDGVVSRTGYKMHQIAPGVWFPRYDIWTSAFISWGNSGGPIIDRRGRVVGMIVEWDGTEIGKPNNSNIAVPGTDLRRFLRTLWGKY